MYSMLGEIEIAPRRCTPGPGKHLKLGKRIERKIALAGRAAKFVAADTFEKIARQFAGLEKFFESEMRVDAGGNDAGGEFFAGLQNDTRGAAIFNQDFADGR